MKRNMNFLSAIPIRRKEILWEERGGIVTLCVENKGLFCRLTQLLLNKPKTSYVHLDTKGSYAWCMMDGSMSVEEMGKKMEEQFGDKSTPVYDRLLMFCNTLKSCRFIEFIV